MQWIATSPTALWSEKTAQPTQALPQLAITERRQQTMIGFGGCFNEIGWRTLQGCSGLGSPLSSHQTAGGGPAAAGTGPLRVRVVAPVRQTAAPVID